MSALDFLLLLFGVSMLVFGFYRLIVGIRQIRAFITNRKSKNRLPPPS